eukprot:TRINITY_DN107343_c0_g1_i1.p1 TRINITY_DN107343_c0_g1~~TRINITY_DN107343_c0_g1_i1.p1  ORF type:complete len:210 (-),score=58.72 TRINITY_DN107343_c0_g1_i1:34-663(-)
MPRSVPRTTAALVPLSARGPPSARGPLSARTSASAGVRSALAQSGRSCLASAASVEDEEDEQRAMRREAKMAAYDRIAGGRETSRRGPGAKPVASSAPSESRGVDPCYFDYDAAVRHLDSKFKKEFADKRSADAGDAADQDLTDLMQFFSAQGLQGPVKSYARALALQGIADTAALVEADDGKLSKVLKLAELESTDEILLLEALRLFR